MLDPSSAEVEESPSPTDAPLPVEPIRYATPTGSRMPTSHVVISVLSLVIACGSVLFSGYTGVVSWMLIHFSSMTAPMRGPGIVPRALTPGETAAVLGRLTAVGVPSAMNSAQTAAFAAMLQAPRQQLVAPLSGPGSVPLASQSITAFQENNGNVVIHCVIAPDSSNLTLDPAGRLVWLNINAWSTSGTVTTINRSPNSSSTKSSSGFPGLPAGRTLPEYMLLAGSAVHLLLAVLLVIAAILLLARRELGVQLIRLYAWIKIPAAVAAGVATIWLLKVMSGGRSTTLGFVALEAAPAAIGVTYAAVILAVLRDREFAKAA